jgi:hypothetical protein
VFTEHFACSKDLLNPAFKKINVFPECLILQDSQTSMQQIYSFNSPEERGEVREISGP